MDNQEQHHRRMTENLISLQMAKTVSESGFQSQSLEQRLENYDARVGRESAVLGKFYVGNLVDFGVNLGFTRFHLRWPPALSFFSLEQTEITQQRRVTAMF